MLQKNAQSAGYETTSADKDFNYTHISSTVNTNNKESKISKYSCVYTEQKLWLVTSNSGVLLVTNL